MMQKSQLQELLKNIRVEISRADNLKAINNIATLLEKLMAYCDASVGIGHFPDLN